MRATLTLLADSHAPRPLPLGEAFSVLLSADGVAFRSAIESDTFVDPLAPVAQALHSLRLYAATGRQSCWQVAERVLDYSVGKRRGGQRHGRAVVLLCWMVEHRELGTLTVDALVDCFAGPPELNRLKLAAASLLQCMPARSRASACRASGWPTHKLLQLLCALHGCIPSCV